jgi:hypothetical protein
MDKAMYKQLVADLMRTESELKSVLQTILDAVKEHPNDMELGGIIRSMFWDKRDVSDDNQLNIFESPDGGKTIYKRKSGDYSNRAKVIKLHDTDS